MAQFEGKIIIFHENRESHFAIIIGDCFIHKTHLKSLQVDTGFH